MLISSLVISAASCASNPLSTASPARPATLVFHDLPDEKRIWTFTISETNSDYAVVEFHSKTGVEHRVIVSPFRLSAVVDEFAANVVNPNMPIGPDEGIDLTLDDGIAARRFKLDTDAYNAALWKSLKLLNLVYQFVPEEFKARRHSVITLGNAERQTTETPPEVDEQTEFTFTGFGSDQPWKLVFKTQLKDNDATLIEPKGEAYTTGWVLLFGPQSRVFDELNTAASDPTGPASVDIDYALAGVTKHKTIKGTRESLTKLLHRLPRFSVLCWQCAPVTKKLETLGYR